MKEIEQLITLIIEVPNEKIILFIIIGLVLILWKMTSLIKGSK